MLVFYFPVQDLDAALESYGSTAKEYCYLLDGEDEIMYHPYQKKLECGISEEWSYEYLDAGTLEALQDKYGVSTKSVIEQVREWVKGE